MVIQLNKQRYLGKRYCIDGQTHYVLIRSIETVGKALKAIKKQPLIKEAQLMAAFYLRDAALGCLRK